MSQPTATRVKRPFMLRIVYFVLHPLSLFFLVGLVAVLFLAAPVRLMISPVTLPEFAGPEQEDFWSLQKKLIDNERSQTAGLSLTTSEFNAFLTRFQVLPEAGFCLQRLRCTTDETGAALYVIGSGFFMRSLIFKLEIAAENTQLRVVNIKINSLEIPATNWFSRQVLDYLRSQAVKNTESFVTKVITGKSSIEFFNDHVRLAGEFMPTKQKNENEELPDIEEEELPAKN